MTEADELAEALSELDKRFTVENLYIAAPPGERGGDSAEVLTYWYVEDRDTRARICHLRKGREGEIKTRELAAVLNAGWDE